MEKNDLQIILAPIYEKIWTKKRLKVFFGGRGAGRTHSVARYILVRALKEKLRVWCAREIQDSIWQSVHHVFCEIIELYNLSQYFKITDNDITCLLTGSYFMFKGFRGNGGQYSEERLKAFEDFDILWIEEAAACTMNSLLVVSKTIRKDGSEIIATFNRVLEEDPIWLFGCYDVGDIYKNKIYEDDSRIVIYATVDDNPFASKTFLEERETDKKRLSIDEYNKTWLGYPDRSGGLKALFPRDLLYSDISSPDIEEYGKYEVIVGVDPNGGGKDRACAVARQGRRIIDIKLFDGIKDPLELANSVIAFKHEHKANKVFCDRAYGQAIIAISTQLGERIIPVDFGGKSSNPDLYGNKRAEIYCKVKDWLYDGGYIGDKSDKNIVELRRELQCVDINTRKTDDGKIFLAPKDDIRKKLGGRSPDIADAFALTFAGFKDKIVRDKNGIELATSEDYAVFDINNGDFRKYC